jgi:hypothetical protein
MNKPKAKNARSRSASKKKLDAKPAAEEKPVVKPAVRMAVADDGSGDNDPRNGN